MPAVGEVDALLSGCCDRAVAAKLSQQFQEQEEFIYLPGFFSSELLQNLLLPQMEQTRSYIHRNYIPMHKKGGSVSAFSIAQQAPLIHQLYKSQAMQSFLTTLSGAKEPLLVSPEEDPHAVSP